MHIIKPSERITIAEFSFCYRQKDDPGSGFSFPSDREGNILLSELKPEGLANLKKCQSGELNVTEVGVVDYSHTYTEDAIGRCTCGAKVTLSGFTNDCEKCGRLYNMSGQSLKPRNQWSENY